MTVLAYDNLRFSGLVKREYDPASGYCRDAVVFNGPVPTVYTPAQVPNTNPLNSMPVGSVLGKVTATGKYKLLEATATDGSQVAAGVYIADGSGFSHNVVIVAATDIPMLVLSRGPVIISAAALSYGASVNTAALIATMVAQLKALGIIAEITA
jgi:hypothetical protein